METKELKINVHPVYGAEDINIYIPVDLWNATGLPKCTAAAVRLKLKEMPLLDTIYALGSHE